MICENLFAFLQFGVKALRTLIVLLLIARSTDVATTYNRHRTRSKRGVIIEKFQNDEYFSEHWNQAPTFFQLWSQARLARCANMANMCQYVPIWPIWPPSLASVKEDFDLEMWGRKSTSPPFSFGTNCTP